MENGHSPGHHLPGQMYQEDMCTNFALATVAPETQFKQTHSHIHSKNIITDKHKTQSTAMGSRAIKNTGKDQEQDRNDDRVLKPILLER